MEAVRGEMGKLQLRVDRMETYQQMHLRSMVGLSDFIVAKPPENLPKLDDGEASAVVEQPTVDFAKRKAR